MKRPVKIIVEGVADVRFVQDYISFLFGEDLKEKTDIELLERIILNCLGSDEVFINKAIGWALRDCSKFNPDWVRSFIGKNQDQMSNLTIKEASKYI